MMIKGKSKFVCPECGEQADVIYEFDTESNKGEAIITVRPAAIIGSDQIVEIENNDSISEPDIFNGTNDSGVVPNS